MLSGELLCDQEAIDEERSPRSLHTLAISNVNRICQQADFACGFSYQLHGLRDKVVFEDHGASAIRFFARPA